MAPLPPAPAPPLLLLLALGATASGGDTDSCPFTLGGLARLKPCSDPSRPVNMGCWKYYSPKAGGVQFLPAGVRMWNNDSDFPISDDGTVIYFDLPASCLAAADCIEVKGEVESRSLTGSRLFLQQELFTGFPGPRPPLSNCSAGERCCYDPEKMVPCAGAPFGKPCRALYASGIALQPASIAGAGGADYSWQYELTSSYVSFSNATQTTPPRVERSNFSLLVDYAAETYGSWSVGKRRWGLSAVPLGIYSPDDNCAHVQAWVPAEWEFNLRLLPVSSHTAMASEATLFELDVVLHPAAECAHRRRRLKQKSDDELPGAVVARPPYAGLAYRTAAPAAQGNIFALPLVGADNITWRRLPDGSWTPPNISGTVRRLVSTTNAMPVGLRAIRAWDLYRNESSHPSDNILNDADIVACKGRIHLRGEAVLCQDCWSIWWDAGIAETRSLHRGFLQAFKAAGGKLDMWVVDDEQGGSMHSWHIATSSTDKCGRAKYGAIERDRRWPAMLAKLQVSERIRSLLLSARARALSLCPCFAPLFVLAL